MIIARATTAGSVHTSGASEAARPAMQSEFHPELVMSWEEKLCVDVMGMENVCMKSVPQYRGSVGGWYPLHYMCIHQCIW